MKYLRKQQSGTDPMTYGNVWVDEWYVPPIEWLQENLTVAEKISVMDISVDQISSYLSRRRIEIAEQANDLLSRKWYWRTEGSLVELDVLYDCIGVARKASGKYSLEQCMQIIEYFTNVNSEVYERGF